METIEQTLAFNEIVSELSEALDITEQQFNAAVRSYKAVGGWLCNEDSLLKEYSPIVQPQGSLIIGTTVQPVNLTDDIDIDVVCELTGKNPAWTQKDLKKIVGDQIEKHKKYESILDTEGRRCWTLRYREESTYNDKYHMDILPAITAKGYREIVNKAFSEFESKQIDQLSIRITDKKELNYSVETNPDFWLKSNPFGYAKWFMEKATIKGQSKFFSLNEAVKPVPAFQTDKFPLQRAVQILKRHRDIMFKGHKDKPISVIITTLAGYAYRGQSNLLDAITDIVDRMYLFIDDKQDDNGRWNKFIGNPVNGAENFADKWIETPAKKDNFYRWLNAIKNDLNDAAAQRGSQNIIRVLSKSFGEKEVFKAFSNIGNKSKNSTANGSNRFDTKTGISISAANIIRPHNFFGNAK